MSEAITVPPAIAEALNRGTTNGTTGTGGAPAAKPSRSGSGLRRRLWVQLVDGTELEAVTAAADAMRYEDTYKKPLFDGMSVTTMGFLAWAALRRTGQIADKWPVFQSQIADVNDITDDDTDAVDPTRTDPSDD